jgi:hypothetical protein
MDGKGYMCYSAPNSIARTSMADMVHAFGYCTTKLTSHSICLHCSDIIEYSLGLLIQRQIGTRSMALWTATNRIETNNSCVQQIGGKRSITQDRRCLRQRWKSRTIQIGSILVQDEEVCCYSLDVLNFSNGPNGQSNLIQNWRTIHTYPKLKDHSHWPNGNVLLSWFGLKMSANLVRHFLLYIYFTIEIRIYCYFYVYSLCNPNRFLHSVSFSYICQPQIPADESMKDETPHTEILNFTHITISFYVTIVPKC